ncbi:MAG: MATE family efflux transporter [Planctomycetia bacterium]|nr:MATE family efflux transporter [Planctomycetia bacterium]
MLGRLTRFWRGPAGMREVLVLSLPLVVSTLSWTVMNFADRVFLIWYSDEAVAAALPAGVLSFVIICFPLGVATYVNAFVAQYYGAQRYGRIGLVVWQGVWIGLISVPAAVATNLLAPAIFAGSGHSPEIAVQEVIYYQALSWGAGAMVIAAALSSFFTGRGNMRTVMIVDSACSMVDIVLDYAWIFGALGFPAWGIAGAAWSTVLGQWLKVIVYLALWLSPRYREKYQTLAGCRFDPALFKRLLHFGSPNGVQFLSEVGAFSLFLLVVGKLGTFDLAATSLAFNVNSLAFMPVYGIGIATTTLVGQKLGQNHPRLAARGTWNAFLLAAGYMAAVCVLYVGVPDALLWLYGLNVDPADFGALRDLTIVLLRFVAFYCLFDAMLTIFASAIKGAGDTRFVLITTLVTSPLPVLATVVGIDYLGMGLFWSWVAITTWITVLGLIYLARFQQGKWRSMRVIEKAPTDEDDIAPDLDEPLDEVPAFSGETA